MPIAQESSEVVYNGFTRLELSTAFDMVKSPMGWKCAINKNLPTSMVTPRLVEMILSSIDFYAGGGGQVYYNTPGVVLFSAPGYYELIGS